MWFGVHTGKWEREGKSPLWLDCRDGRWVPIPVVVKEKDVEYAEVLDRVVSALQGFAEDSGNRR